MVEYDRWVDVLIVGGGPGGFAVARGYREAGGGGTVLLISADEHPPYARPPLTKDYLRGESEAADLPLADEDWYRENAVELRLGIPVLGIDADRKRAQLADGSTVGYERLALVTGSSPIPLPIPGADLPGLVYVRDRHSGEALRGLAQAADRVRAQSDRRPAPPRRALGRGRRNGGDRWREPRRGAQALGGRSRILVDYR